MFAAKDQDHHRRPGGRGLTHNHHGAIARRLRRAAAGAMCAAAIALPFAGAAGAQAATTAPSVTYTKLTMINGWGGYSGSASPAVADISGIVHFKGAISASTGDTNNVPFVLPPGFRPNKFVNIPVDMCNATAGELNIAPSGVTQVIPQGPDSDATCFTSLDGVSFPLSTGSFTTLNLQPGWSEFDSFFRKAAVRDINGIVHFEGQIKTAGTNAAVFTLPAGFRPSKNVYVQVNLCTAGIGRLHITPSGAVTVKPGIVHLKGAIWTNGTNADPFVLPAGFRPANEIFIPVDLCGGNNGRLNIQPNGVVTVEQQTGDPFSNAQCFTSLDGASFAA